MSDVKFHNDKYRQFKYNFKDSIVNKRRFNHPIERESIGLSISKEYNLFCNHQKENEENNKKNLIGIRLLYYF